MFKKISVKEQIKEERARRLQQQNEQSEKEAVVFNQLIDLDFRQSLNELGVDVNDL